MMPTTAVAVLMTIFSVLVPTKQWYGAEQPITVQIDTTGRVHLILTDFPGRSLEPAENVSIAVEGPISIDIESLYPQVKTPGTYVLYASREPDSITDFEGTPIVISVRADKRMGGDRGAMVTHVVPLQYVKMQTEHGPMTLGFYYDVAPNTVDNFLSLASQGYYDGLTFHRVIPGFVIQGGDPRGDGTGNPGYTIPAEFNNRRHMPGVLSMARQGDPNERSGAMPRPQFADSAGSQFFVCLTYEQCQQLDGKYTAFGRVIEGMAAVDAIANSPIGDGGMSRPVNPPKMTKVEVVSVTAANNPYPTLRQQMLDSLSELPATTQPID